MNSRDALWAEGHDETVEVNQRALIDKVLARYSGEFTVFRELLQNSDDAAAHSVEIHFETKGYLERNKQEQASIVTGSISTLPDLKTSLIHQWSFKNNGMVFRDEDWNRLKKIAEGNPDEEKIGAFGVGFYSLFSVTEEPFVTSGGQWMGFHWKDKKDQLFARRGSLPASDDSTPDPWTTFEMSLREPAPMPAAFDFTRFLVNSITFMSHLNEVSVFFDDKRLARLTKASGSPDNVPLLRGLNGHSPQGIMNVKGIQKTPLDIRAEVMRWVYSVGSEKPLSVTSKPAKSQGGGFFSSLFGLGSSTPQRAVTPQPVAPAPDVDLTEINESSVRLSIFAANVDVRLDKKMTAELLRSTKKNPPSKVKFELIYTGKDEYEASVQAENKIQFATGSVFQGLRADLTGSGSARIFIGHSTGQTTGIGGHMAARFIPTVERESVDLVDRNVAVWNKELLYVGGFLARSAYELELSDIKRLWEGASSGIDKRPDPDIQTWLQGRALHALKFFTFHLSTPSSVVSSLMEAGFFSCATAHAFAMISSEGVRDANNVRIPDPVFSGFLKRVPFVPDDVLSGAKTMIGALSARNLIKEISFADVLAELKSRPLTEAEAVACLKWWINLHNQESRNGNDPLGISQGRSQLLNAAVVTSKGDGDEETIVTLSTVKTFLNSRGSGGMIPSDGPLPQHLLPLAISRSFDPEVLASVFSWKQLSVLDWLRFVTQQPITNVEFDLSRSPQWAERVLLVLSRAWPSMSKTHQDQVIEILKVATCVPTSSGMKTPEQAYFSTVKLFQDLPIVTMPSGQAVRGPLEKLLTALGVRKHVELQIIFDRMIKTGDWTIYDLVKYLVSVKSTLSATELDKLRQTAAFPLESSSKDSKVTRRKAADLYEPSDTLRDLGLPILDWGKDNKWRPSSEEAKFLYSLGLRQYPSLDEIIRIAALGDANLRTKGLRYLLDNFTSRYSNYTPSIYSDVAFIPSVRDSKAVLAKPSEVFAAPEWAALGFTIVEPNLREEVVTKLKIDLHPPPSRLVALLEKAPPAQSVARVWFETLASRTGEFSRAELRRLSMTPFVPVQDPSSKENIRRLCPNQCYFSGASGPKLHLLQLFTFIDFGDRANGFLNACGTKNEPSVEEIVNILLKDPRDFFGRVKREHYLLELRNVAVNRRLLSTAVVARMQKSPMLVGLKRVKVPNKSEKKGVDGDDDDWDTLDRLLRPDQVIVADDTNAYQLFGDSVFSAPQEDLLEDFYLWLGSQRLSVMVQEDHSMSAEIRGSRTASEIKALILERLPLFLHEHTHSRTRIQFSWLSADNNFVVRTFGKLSTTKSLIYEGQRLTRVQDASAVAIRRGKGPIELWLAGNTQVDMYEVSTSLCRFLFESPKINDALLFMTILSTDIRALRRRGYNVDRILRQQKEQREAEEKAIRIEQEKHRAEMEAKQLSKPPPIVPTPVGVSHPTATPDSLFSATVPAQDLTSSTPSNNAMVPRDVKEDVKPDLASDIKRHSTNVMNSLQSFRQKIVKRNDYTSNDSRLSSDFAEETNSVAGPSSQASNTLQAPTRPSPLTRSPTPNPSSSVTPLSNIASNIDMAIKSCTEEKSDLLRNREQMQMVKESLDEGYCDVLGRTGDLDLVGTLGDIKVYAAQDVKDRHTLVARKQDALKRFVDILHPIRSIYNLPPASLHIFTDTSGDLIAFNRNGSIFLNLRYYEAWHDREVTMGSASNAYISWFFTLAHEIAHNLVLQHNSEHEFYFSSICEKYVGSLAHILVHA